MLRPGSPSAIEAQACLDRKIEELTLSICKLRTERNALSLIARLSPDVLSAVFIHNVRAEHQSITDQNDRPVCQPEWVNVSYVCREWRDVALNCPTFWSYLGPKRPHWIEAQLSRSKKAPLRVHLYHFDPRVLAHTSRIQELKMERLRTPMFSDNKLSCPAPLLQSLEIHVEQDSRWNTSCIPCLPFSEITPALRHVKFSNFFVPLSPSMVSNLTTLILSNLTHPIEPTITVLKATLCPMQKLVHLELHRSIKYPRSDSEPTSNSENVHLPCLQRLSIIDPLSLVVQLLSCLEIPPHTEVRLHCLADRNVAADDYTPLHPFIAALFRPWTSDSQLLPLTIRTLVMKRGLTDTDIGLVFSAIEDDCDRLESTPDWGCNVPLKLTLHVSKPKNEQDVVKNVCQNIPLTGLKSVAFSLDTSNDRCSTFWQDVLGSFAEVVYIYLSGARISLGCLSLLLSSTPHCKFSLAHQNETGGTSAPSSSTIFLPALEVLRLVDVTFLREDPAKGDSNAHTGNTVSAFVKALAVRGEKGYPLKRLFLQECRNVLFEKDVARFRTVVENVVWDGVTRSAREDEEPEDEQWMLARLLGLRIPVDPLSR